MWFFCWNFFLWKGKVHYRWTQIYVPPSSYTCKLTWWSRLESVSFVGCAYHKKHTNAFQSESLLHSFIGDTPTQSNTRSGWPIFGKWSGIEFALKRRPSHHSKHFSITGWEASPMAISRKQQFTDCTIVWQRLDCWRKWKLKCLLENRQIKGSWTYCLKDVAARQQ